jgi:dTDP-4-amino-4,6-dideoxygalactose transaminase
VRALAAAQGRFALYLALKHLIQPGQEVILSPYTIYDVVNMVVCAGGRPVFADIEAQSCNIDARRVAALIGPNTGAVLVTHLHGLACDMDSLAELCRSKGVALVEDAAQAFGATLAGRPLGTIGDAGIFSFGRVKNLNAFFGGMLVCRDPALYARVAADIASLPFEEEGRLAKRIVACLVSEAAMSAPAFQLATFWALQAGCLWDVRAVNQLVQTENDPVARTELPERYLRRMTPMQARIVRAQLPHVTADTEARQHAAEIYFEGLSDVPELGLPPRRRDGSHVYLSFPVQAPDRWALVKHLMRRRRDVSIQHIGNTADLAVFSAFASDCPVARRVAARVVLLPTYPGYGAAHARANVAAIRAFYGAPALSAAVNTNNWLAPSRKVL